MNINNSDCVVLSWLMICCFCLSYASAGSVHTDIILVGATGDLAKKYLWNALFQLYSKEQSEHKTFALYGCARENNEVGTVKLKEIIIKSVQCGHDNECTEAKNEFSNKITYKQFKSEKDYEAFGKLLAKSLHATDDIINYTRIFYLAIPPFAYEEASRYIHSYCRPKLQNSTIKVVLEKPFGRDENSARELAGKISAYFTEDEIYRIDHYLGKAVVKEILPFRLTIDNIWNRHYISSVEIAMKETVDVKDRVLFYEEYGVFRDVIQNHLTELLILVAMELPKNHNDIYEIEQKKLELLSNIDNIDDSMIVTGQYNTYASEVKMEKSINKTNVPTFAAVNMFIDNQRWKGVPFLVLSGKKLDIRHSYIKVNFKDNLQLFGNVDANCGCNKEILFNIGHGPFGEAGILVSKTFANLLPRNVLDKLNQSEDYFVMFPTFNNDAYSALISAIYHGQRDQFIGTDHLLKSWNIWSEALHKRQDTNPDVIYVGSDQTAQELNFQYDGKSLFFADEHQLIHDYLDKYTTAFFGGQAKILPLVNHSSELTLLSELEKDMLASANKAIKDNGVFHIAFSGGRSPVRLFRYLAQSVNTFPWHKTHVWLVDERCVLFNNSLSNFNSLWENLLSKVSIPFWNIHPMPVETTSGICLPWEQNQYEQDIKRIIPEEEIDLILLGLGNDGHVASLFPGQDSLHSTNEKLVVYAKTGDEETNSKSKRMTLTFEMINKSRKIGILVTGKEKSNILNKLRFHIHEINITKWPITGVNPESGNLLWYINSEAWENSHLNSTDLAHNSLTYD